MSLLEVKDLRVSFDTPEGEVVTTGDFTQAIGEAAPERFRQGTLRSIGGNLYASWTQSGHLTGYLVLLELADLVVNLQVHSVPARCGMKKGQRHVDRQVSGPVPADGGQRGGRPHRPRPHRP